MLGLSTERESVNTFLAMRTQGSRSGFPIIPGAALLELEARDDISGQTLVQVRERPGAATTRTSSAGASARRPRRHQQDQRHYADATGEFQYHKRKAPSSVLGPQSFTRKYLSKNGDTTGTTTSSNDRRTQLNRRDDAAQEKEYRDRATDI
jgi:hypothetical protein